MEKIVAEIDDNNVFHIPRGDGETFSVDASQVISERIDEALAPRLEEKDAEIQQLKEELEVLKSYVEAFKKYLIDDYLQSNVEIFGKEPIENLLHLVKLRKLDLVHQKNETVQPIKPPKPTINPGTEEYSDSEICVCGRAKTYGAKGCESCRKEADRIRKSDDCSREEAWETVWETWKNSQEDAGKQLGNGRENCSGNG